MTLPLVCNAILPRFYKNKKICPHFEVLMNSLSMIRKEDCPVVNINTIESIFC